MSQPGAFTGRDRKRKTKRSVRAADKISHFVITVGGIGTIVAVALILVFLVWVILPLFQGAAVDDLGARVEEAEVDSPLLRVALDEFRVVAWDLRRDGEVRLRRLDSGEILDRQRVFPPDVIRSISIAADGDRVALGLADGRVALGEIGFETAFREPEDAPEEYRGLIEGESARWETGMVQRTPAGQLRRQNLRVDLGAPIAIGASAPIVRVDRSELRNGTVVAALTADGELRVVRLRKNPMTGKLRRKGRPAVIEVAPFSEKGMPRHLVLSGLADNVYLLWEDGHLVRHNVRNLAEPFEAEVIDTVPESDARLTAVGALVGKGTVLVGDSRSRLRAWSLATSLTGETRDNMNLVLAGEFVGSGAAISAITASTRGRMAAAGYEDGSVALYYVTSGKDLGEVRIDGARPIEMLALAPRDDELAAVSGTVVHRWGIDAGYPEATFGNLFGKVLYEGRPEAEYVWQSSGASDDVEMKLSLMPLVFGTLKATLYSMLFAVPLALLAAIYTSEFLSSKVRPRVKSVVEVMASLPSVVLGFVAAFVIAPFVESVVPAVLSAFLTIPFVFILGANLWQLLPRSTTLGLERFRLAFVAAMMPVGIGLAALLAPVLEGVFFAGDIKGWLAHQHGSAIGGWALILLPLGILAAALLYRRFFGHLARGLSEAGAARYSLVRLGVTIVLAFVIVYSIGGLLQWSGADPRGGVVGTYVQLNALVVGFAMGFAVIPIIYTIAEDALSAVPEHLRAASLGAGATPWQTAVRVIVPTAASGLFSACMIGLGRAVGETMIVLMAAGNTPIMEWNPFNGFETLSAAIATEMPEAVRDSTHYRVLFLSGLTLFAMTFVVNTIAEAVRLRFRRRAFQL